MTREQHEANEQWQAEQEQLRQQHNDEQLREWDRQVSEGEMKYGKRYRDEVSDREVRDN